jgi:hypothetical protein
MAKNKLMLVHVANETEIEFDAAVTVPSKKNPTQLARFINRIINPGKQREGDEPRQKPNALMLARNVKVFEKIVQIQTMVGATDQEVYMIFNGGLVGTFLLNQFANEVDASWVYHGFDPEEWNRLQDVKRRSKYVVHIFYGSREAVEKDEEYAEVLRTAYEVEVFQPKAKIEEQRGEKKGRNKGNQLASLVQADRTAINALDLDTAIGSTEDRKAMLQFFRIQVILRQLFEVGASKVAVKDANLLSAQQLDALEKEFSVEYVGFPEEAFGGIADKDKLLELSGRFKVKTPA